MRSIRLLAENDYDLSSVAGGLSIAIPLHQKLDVRRLGCANLALRLHAANIPAGANVRLVIKEAAPTSQDPAAFFRGRILGVCQLDSTSIAPALVTAYAALTTAHVAVFLVVRQAPTAATFTCTLSADLIPRDAVNPWTPAQLGSLKLWLDERDQTIVSGAVSNWGDESGSGNNFIQATAAYRPAADTNLNAWPAPRFDGVGKELYTTTPISGIIGASAYHVFAVCNPTSLPAPGANIANDAIVIMDYGGWWGMTMNTNGVSAWQRVAAQVSVGPIALAANDACLLEWSWDGATIRLRVNGGPTSTTATNLPPAYTSWGAYLGWINNSAFAGPIASVLVCNQYLSAADAGATRAYLSSKYGVPA